MKTIKTLCVAAVAAMMLVSCGNGNDVKLENSVDSLNYAFGYLNGGDMRGYVQQRAETDTLTEENVDAFIDAFGKAFMKLEGDDKVKMGAESFAQSFAMFVKGDMLFGDSTIAYDEELFMENFEKVLKFEEAILTQEQSMMAIQTTMYVRLDSGAVRSQGQLDSLNIAFAVVNAAGIREDMLDNDSTGAYVELFMEEFKDKISKEADEFATQGMAIGMQIFKQFEVNPFLMNDSTQPFNAELVEAGIFAGFRQDTLTMNREKAEAVFNAYIEAKQAKENAERDAQMGRNKIEGLKFLEDNKTKEGVKVTESGLQYVVNELGKGKKPTAENTVKLHYEGKLIDGTVFDSSIQRGQPIEFPLNGVIKGWTEGVQLMPIGSKFTFYIPYELAYGENGAGSIPPCSVLIFDVELIDIVK